MEQNHNLEEMLNGRSKRIFKSQGERRIAHFLEDNSINYQYEPSLLVKSAGGKPRIWYPDFYLPECKTYIEYYGMAGNLNYNLGIKTKETAYSKMGLDVISVYPWMFAENWKGYIMRELKRSSARQYKNLMSKPYWRRHRPLSHNNVRGYHRSRSNLY
jgi:hypothetical protein